MTLIEIARLFRYVREITGAQNRGLRVEAIQHWAGGANGDSWCVEALWMWLDMRTQGCPPFGRAQSCETVRGICVNQQWMVDSPGLVTDDYAIIVFSMNAAGIAHHIALLTSRSPLIAIAGNTSRDGKSVNGDGVYEHEISPDNKQFARIPLIRVSS